VSLSTLRMVSEADVPKREKKKMEYMGRLQDFVTEAAPPFEAAVKQARSDGADKVGTLGFCL
jgi:hypothetical protein